MASLPETFSKILAGIFGSRNERYVRSLLPIVAAVAEHENDLRELSDLDLRKKTLEFKERLAGGEALDYVLPEAFAAVREGARRTLGLRHFDVQVVGGIVLHRGSIAEMVTGEGKTLVATLAAYLNALTGRGVHVVTVNDYLARRDRDWMAPVFEALGLTVGAIQSEMDSRERIPQYASDITYGTNNEFGFDYLRDNMKTEVEMQAQLFRGGKNPPDPEGKVSLPLHFAIIDEVDSILIDEARTPLIISGPAEESVERYYVADQAARKLVPDRDFEIKEKEHVCVLSEDGIERAEQLLGVDSLYTGKNMEWVHFIDQALRAHHIYKLDKDYVVKDGQIIIVDEFTGRLMAGRRWSDGLHQAVEAKEKLRIKQESQTLATITFQNFFRLYEKLAGMTGTALTEAAEFDKIYELDVVSIPSNRPLIRKSFEDKVYRTESEKNRAVVDEIVRIHATGRPILVGTISIEKSEQLSGWLGREGIPHDVLNAKQHEREATIVAEAGQLGRVTIATNMAGRGTDIVLGAFELRDLLAHWRKHGLVPREMRTDPIPPDLEDKLLRHWVRTYVPEEELKVDVDKADHKTLRKLLDDACEFHGMAAPRLATRIRDLGGLHILGTSRHEARRIDNQLRGRSGRQGDPGSSRFYLSLDDDLMRLFAPPRMSGMLERLGMTEGVDIQHPWISKAIGNAQKRVESHNFEIRKNLLEYDEVMDQQRRTIYGIRQQVLEGRDLRKLVLEMAEEILIDSVQTYLSEDDVEGFVTWFKRKFDLPLDEAQAGGSDLERIENDLCGRVLERYNAREKEIGAGPLQALQRYLLLQTIDTKWKDHLYAMDFLRSSVRFEGFGGKDPKNEYKIQGFEMFGQMLASIKDEVTELVFRLRYEPAESYALSQVDSVWSGAKAQHGSVESFGSSSGSTRKSMDAAVAQDMGAGEAPAKPVRRVEPKVGRNDPCPCGSGRKYKKCHGAGTP